MNDCIFCQIIEGSAPTHKIWENENFLAFLSIGQINPGHTLLITKKHVDYIFDLEEPLYSKIFQAAKHLSQPLQDAMKAKRIGVAIEGFSVPHIHIHLVPVNDGNELDPNRAIRLSDAELAKIAVKIRKKCDRFIVP
ncbi:HIT family protein [Chroococcidiopsis sp.]|uniref:HIT family protein n=1 Tax=Chroococcidiopsis sp. TaxID=3088168 RepID=UPI003F39AFF5